MKTKVIEKLIQELELLRFSLKDRERRIDWIIGHLKKEVEKHKFAGECSQKGQIVKDVDRMTNEENI